MVRSEPSVSVMKRAMTSTDPLSSISLPNSAPSRKSGKNRARNSAAPPMKVWVQWASSGAPEKAAATSAAPGASKRMLQPRYDSHIRRPSARTMPASPIRSHRADECVEIERRAPAEIGAMGRDESAGASAAFVAQHGQKRPFGVELRRIAELGHHRARDAVDA